ncbi:MAG: hypothetical protein HY073_05645 [Deltaproteobacteria bacterium]|nr:hypothetical protein [Deltaproteobacteria bacterium]
MKRLGLIFFLLFIIIPTILFARTWIVPQVTIPAANVAPGEKIDVSLKSYSAKIIFSSESQIPYAGVYLRVFDASGIIIFKQLCEKPWLFLNLPEGEYNLIAVDRKKVQREALLPVKKGQSQKVVKLSWPKEVVGY